MNHLYYTMKAKNISTLCYKLKKPSKIKCGPHPMKHTYLETCTTQLVTNGLVYSSSYPSQFLENMLFI